MTKLQRSAIDQIEWMRNVLALILVGVFVTTIPLFVFKAIPAANEQLITYMLGQLSGMALTALSFYFVNKVGADALDAKRADNTKAAMEAIKETAKAASGAAPDDAPAGTEDDPLQTEIVNAPDDPVPTTKGVKP